MMYNLCLQTQNMPLQFCTNTSSSLGNHLHFPADTAIVTSRLSLWEGQAPWVLSEMNINVVCHLP